MAWLGDYGGKSEVGYFYFGILHLISVP